MYSSMGFFVEDSAGFIVTHILYKAALIFAFLRWFSSWALRFRSYTSSSPPPPQNDSVSSQLIRDSLVLSTFGDIADRLPESYDTCAVCLGQLRSQDQVRELRNCCHVFHKECIDRWVDHDRQLDHDENHKTCPLCRAPLLTCSQSMGWARPEPSWAVERLLYLFGDDLLTY